MSFHMEFCYPKEAEVAKREKWPILIPVGTMEYHSTHCPYGCDALVSLGLAEKIAEKIDAVVFPTIWYGVASYAVAGPEKNTIHVDCDTFEGYVYCILKSLFRAGFNRNIYLIISHQTEDYNPMALACMKAARKLIFEYLDETMGEGWWGNNENKDFYENMSAMDNPWNWIRVLNGSDTAKEKLGGDHAGRKECSLLEYLFPGTIKLERLAETDDWFAQDAAQMSVEMGRQFVEYSLEDYIPMMLGIK
ncbi:MAG: creatininase family protein [Lachnospiraceae bacterium]|nr:creatininase family protein [Lachnospiraceae bacterium]